MFGSLPFSYSAIPLIIYYFAELLVGSVVLPLMLLDHSTIYLLRHVRYRFHRAVGFFAFAFYALVSFLLIPTQVRTQDTFQYIHATAPPEERLTIPLLLTYVT